MLARGLEVDEQRHLAADLVEQVEVELEAEPAADRGEVDDRVGRAAHRLERDEARCG